MFSWIGTAPKENLLIVAAVIVLALAALVIISLSFRRIRVGKVTVERTAIKDDELDRVGDRVAARVQQHQCQYTEHHEKTADLLEAMGVGVSALLKDAVSQGRNGAIAEASPFVTVRLSDYQKFRNAKKECEMEGVRA